ncbi:unnamed protein product [Cunninghamella echinulata]
MTEEQTTTSKDYWKAEAYETNASFVPKLGNTILSMLEARPNERILDVGCGDGVLTNELAKLCRQVVGVDASADMIQKANILRQHDNTTYHVADCQQLSSWLTDNNMDSFDAVFSNAALHWMKKDPVGVIKGIHQALKPGGRMVAEFGGYMNVGEIHTALISGLNKRGLDGQSYSPWFFPSDTYYQQLLQDNGFDVKYIALVPRPTQLDTDVAGWIKTFGFSF